MVYLDHAASTPMLSEAVEALHRQLDRVGNASSLHAAGRDARRVVEESRETIAQALGARPSEVIFTAGGTESDNLAVKGLFWARRAEDPRRRRIVASGVEHHAVLDSVLWLAERDGAEISWLPVDEVGRVRAADLADLLADLADEVALVTVMWANNEVGTVQPIADLALIAQEHGVPLHTDAIQAVGHVPLDFGGSGAAALSLSGHKFGGPVGAGALLLARGLDVTPLMHGGGQERDVRSGTLDVPALAALATATEIAVKCQPEEADRLVQLRGRLVAGVQAAVAQAVQNGDRSSDVTARLPGITSFSFPGCEGDSLLLLLDARGIECSTGSACSAGVARPSHVLISMGQSPERARSSLRFSLGHTSTAADVDALIEAIGPVVDRASRAALTAGK